MSESRTDPDAVDREPVVGPPHEQVGTTSGDSLLAVLVRREEVVVSPVPPPEELTRYKEVDPKIVDLWLETWERENVWRHQRERLVLWMDFIPRVLGQLFGFSLGAGAFWASVEMIQAGAEASGIATVMTAIGALLAAFVLGKRTRASQEDQGDETES